MLDRIRIRSSTVRMAALDPNQDPYPSKKDICTYKVIQLSSEHIFGYKISKSLLHSVIYLFKVTVLDMHRKDFKKFFEYSKSYSYS